MKIKIVDCALFAFILIGLTGCSESEKDKRPPMTQLDQRMTLVKAAGLMDKRMPMSKLMQQYISVQEVELDSGAYQDTQTSVDDSFSAFAVNSQNAQQLTPSEDIAGIKMRENTLPVYLIKNEQGKVVRLVLPIRAQGKFGLIYGYLGLYRDHYHIASVAFYQHKETPGLGGKITNNPQWIQQFQNLPVFNHGHPAVQVVQNRRSPKNAYSVDGISGATYTSKGVEHAINFWIGKLGFGKFLQQYQD